MKIIGKNRYLAHAVYLAGVCALVFGCLNYFAVEKLISLKSREATFERLNGTIRQIDEVLTMSARMAAATKDPSWEERYNKYDPILVDSINELIEKFPEILIAKKTDEANVKLVDMERRSFELNSQKKYEEAKKILFSDEYVKQKKIYSDGMAESNNLLQIFLKESHSRLNVLSKFAGFFAVLFTFLSIFGWIVITRELKNANHILSDQSKNLKFQIEENTKLSQALIQNAKLASLGEMSAGMAHEINNPLGIIDGSVRYLAKGKNDPEKFDSKIEKIRKAVKRISKIVLGLKKFSRMNDGTQFGLFSLDQIVKESISLTESQAKNHYVEVKYESNTDFKIHCDETEIEQVLINLINNAIYAAKDTSEKWVKISTFENDKNIGLRVEDSGKGIKDDVIDKVFEPFCTTKAVGEGTGLGLSISKGILDVHNAELEILKNYPNTCFEIRFQKKIRLDKGA